ncbi:iron transporter [Chitiniphilus purpureus]|uniref:Iron transporter n=1 Tax=Chitiniphilus purpureus TaxID=2981137 RepID=A0ABY6DH38_9NEIS|nr:iron transporter [Chitiniphilus sp. CD1]UXY13660.1 iron transporter [Chitiniphilus sp. CD1]
MPALSAPRPDPAPAAPPVARRAGKPPAGIPWAYRLAVTLRVLAATLGGYALVYACTGALARWLPLSRNEATLTATLLSFPLYCAVIVWVFSVSSAGRAWLGLGVALAAALGLGWLGAAR